MIVRQDKAASVDDESRTGGLNGALSFCRFLRLAEESAEEFVAAEEIVELCALLRLCPDIDDHAGLVSSDVPERSSIHRPDQRVTVHRRGAEGLSRRGRCHIES